MCESVLYRCEKQSIEDLKIFLNSLKTNWIKLLMNDNDQGEDTVNVGHSECYLKEVENVEDYYDYRQTYLKSLLNSVSKELIKEVWKIVSYIFLTLYQHIVILNDETHLCTCLLLVFHGIVCHHYFKLMIENSAALFHLMLIPMKWLQDDYWNYDNDQNNLDDILLAYISKKEAKLNAKAQSELEGRNILNENINLSNEMKLSDGQVYDINNIKDPIKRQGKGRPAGKRFKAYDEGKNKANSSKNQKENVYEIDIENMNDNSNNSHWTFPAQRQSLIKNFVLHKLAYLHLVQTGQRFNKI
ncbi:unnamed protein product [Rhizophagus irregularis]|uniref:SWIM-type domain-containing protein n=1 Tax=Rhizophagus irregularis TaxID=588596 RepID=A0A915Z8B2_9GLOM|nr:unnamed protein product [Rhizophagus irregularis]CAB5365766.1 unnamed protein product [Rhizophagus irregularis]